MPKMKLLSSGKRRLKHCSDKLFPDVKLCSLMPCRWIGRVEAFIAVHNRNPKGGGWSKTGLTLCFIEKLFSKNAFCKNYFINQLSAVHKVTSLKFEDFMVDGAYVFEVGGGSKTTDQTQGIPNAYLALDIESGNGKRIPLWLFGILYWLFVISIHQKGSL